ncbi:hypothetical protein SLOPH_2718 [Spraguea lophii 42_110]|uniref:Uncharacterized protein n=1 Tax=Spraguea lophii (strain 42_110) TaxID=1358809 RepID=S7XQC4_SPRLO|nr:hypothetical protein SLOPH_2718 [Spraguea lophii 42_110]
MFILYFLFMYSKEYIPTNKYVYEYITNKILYDKHDIYLLLVNREYNNNNVKSDSNSDNKSSNDNNNKGNINDTTDHTITDHTTENNTINNNTINNNKTTTIGNKLYDHSVYNNIDTGELSDLILINNLYYGIGGITSDMELSNICRRVCNRIYLEFKNDRWNFKPKKDFSVYSEVDIKMLIRAGERKDKILNIIEKRDVEIDDMVIEWLKSKQDGRAYGILGDIYFYGALKNKKDNKNINLSMHYYRLGASLDDPISYNGIGKIYETKGDMNSAKSYYEKAISHGSVDALYNLYNFYQKILPYQNMGIRYLKIAAQKKYLPAIYELAEHHYKNKSYRQAIHHYVLVSTYSKSIREIENKAFLKYMDKDYYTAVNLLILNSEAGDIVSMKNIIYIIQNKVIDSIIIDYNKLLIYYLKTLVSVGDNSLINMLGDIYYANRNEINNKDCKNGREYKDDNRNYNKEYNREYNKKNKEIAYGYYLSGALSNITESYYNLYYLYSLGIGCNRDFYRSIECIKKVYENESNSYLVVIFMILRIILLMIIEIIRLIIYDGLRNIYKYIITTIEIIFKNLIFILYVINKLVSNYKMVIVTLISIGVGYVVLYKKYK